MLTRDFYYHLPKNRIAQKPMSPRDHSKVMVIDRKDGSMQHDRFFHLAKYLQNGDVLVFNNSKVIPARLRGAKKETRGKIEVFLIHKINLNSYQVMVGHSRAFIGLRIIFGRRLEGMLTKEFKNTSNPRLWKIEFNAKGNTLETLLHAYGLVPLPPYIKTRGRSQKLWKQYQTLYAKISGSVAAPTAGFHFTKRLFRSLEKRHIQCEYITLHVGLGTFLPVKSKRVEDHPLHSEYATIDAKTSRRLNAAKRQGKRIIAVGTTSVRTLESFTNKKGRVQSGSKWTNIFIYPGYRFQFVDAMITNFHLPESSLLMLVSAFAGRKNIDRAYSAAIKKRYRFYSFGDGMLIQ